MGIELVRSVANERSTRSFFEHHLQFLPQSKALAADRSRNPWESFGKVVASRKRIGYEFTRTATADEAGNPGRLRNSVR